jgi:hypothetical protein
MSDATVRFVVEMDPSGQVKAVKAIQGLGDEGARQGKRFGDGLRGGFQGAAKEWAAFIAGGMALQRVFSSITNTIKQAGDIAKARQAEFDKTNNTWRATRLARIGSDAALRLAGVDEGSVGPLQDQLNKLKASGRDVGGDFSVIARALAQRGLQGSELGGALKTALDGLGKRGHLDGFGDAYAALASGKGVAAGADLTDLATGMIKRSFGMGDDQARALREGIASGAVGVDQGGMVRALGEASAELAAALKAVNGAGGLSLREMGKPNALNGLDPRVGYGYTLRAAQDGGLDWQDPGQSPDLKGKRPDGAPGIMDYVTAFFDEGTIQAAMGALLIKILDGGVKRALTSLATTTATRAAPVLTSAAARGGGAAANAAARALSAPVSLLSIWQEGGMSQDEEDAKILASMESRTSRREVARKIMKRTGVSEFDAEAFINRTEAEFNIEKEGVWSNAATQGNTLAEIRDILKVQLSLMNQSVILVPAQTGD